MQPIDKANALIELLPYLQAFRGKTFLIKMGNELEISVVNLWPNRLIGDASLPPGKRFTETNIRKFVATTPLLPSGLLGPVTILNQH